ncbi:hypothetical protein ABB02_01584 [Clostridiaceae bacterium JG1575]|nr:hypothetical protein ABB02_01584 [Clostridiaceae bacterium JG1575]
MKTRELIKRVVQSQGEDLKLNGTLLETPQARGLAVIFPGKGYNADKPLLYYSIRMAIEKGYNLLILSYGPFEFNLVTRSAMTRLVAGLVGDVLKEAGEGARMWDLLFIGKSVGALFAADAAKNLKRTLPLKCIYLTPLQEMAQVVRGTDFIAFAGDQDPLFDIPSAKRTLGLDAPKIRVLEGADHSLTTASTEDSLKILNQVISEMSRFIDAPKPQLRVWS